MIALRAEFSARWRRRDAGFAILLVLWVMVLLSAIGLHITGGGRTELKIARNVMAAAQAEALADGAVAQAIFAVIDPDRQRRWALDGRPHEMAVNGGRLRMAVRDENAKVNPNLAPEQLVAALLRQVGVEQTTAGALATAIAERVRPTAFSPGGGDRRPQLFSGIDALREVPGMTASMVDALRAHVSVYATAALPVPGPDDKVVAAALDDFRARSGGDNRSRTNPSAQPDKITVAIAAEAVTTNGATFRREAVVRLDSAVPKGHVVLQWRRGEAPPN